MKTVTLKYFSDGQIDPRCFVSADERAVARWIESVLAVGLARSGHHGGGDASADIISVLQDPRLPSLGRLVLSKSLMKTLELGINLSWDDESPQDVFRELVFIFQHERLVDCAGQFLQRLKVIANPPEISPYGRDDKETAKKRQELHHSIVFMAVTQTPAWLYEESLDSWLKLLKMPVLTTLALMGISKTFTERCKYLEVWWAHCPPEDRERELLSMVFSAARVEGKEVVERFCSGSPLSIDLRDAFQDAFQLVDEVLL